MPGRDHQDNLRSVSITQSMTHNTYSLSISQQGRSSQLPVWNKVRRGAARDDPRVDSIVCWWWLQGRNEECMLYSLQMVTDVVALVSTQQDADPAGVILHSIYSVQNEDVERIIIHANDT